MYRKLQKYPFYWWKMLVSFPFPMVYVIFQGLKVDLQSYIPALCLEAANIEDQCQSNSRVMHLKVAAFPILLIEHCSISPVFGHFEGSSHVGDVATKGNFSRSTFSFTSVLPVCCGAK